MSDKQIPVTVSIDEAASRRRMEEQLARLAGEIGSKAKVTLDFQLDSAAVAEQSRRLASAVQESLNQTSLKVSNVQMDKSAGNALTKSLELIGSQASDSLSKSIKNAGRRYMPAAARR